MCSDKCLKQKPERFLYENEMFGFMHIFIMQ